MEDLSISVAEGSVYGLRGLNASGKTTSIKPLLALLRPRLGSNHRPAVAHRHARLNGPQRFENLWTDPDPVPLAFERHVGKSVAAWFRAAADPERPADPTRAVVTVPFGLWLEAGLLAALCVGVAVLVVSRREAR